MTSALQRRRFILGLAAAALSAPAAARLLATPAQSAGPFYPETLPLDHDNDLTRVAGQARTALGDVSDVGGRLLDLDGRPLRDVRVEIWQCDALGRYRHPLDRGAAMDPGFQGFGRTVTDAQGRYRFRTIRPVPYPGRAPHIHFAVYLPNEPRFTTQLYVAGDARNEADFLFRAVPPARRHLVQAAFQPSQADGVKFEASFDLIVGGTPRM